MLGSSRKNGISRAGLSAPVRMSWPKMNGLKTAIASTGRADRERRPSVRKCVIGDAVRTIRIWSWIHASQREVARRHGPDSTWPPDFQLLHPRLESRWLDAKNFRCPMLAADSPSCHFKDLDDVPSFRLLQSQSIVFS